MKIILFIGLLLHFASLRAQTNNSKLPTLNIRLSLLVFPPISPLLTFEIRTINKLTVQLETNFTNIHGVNFKYFLNERMNGHYVFIGKAFIKSDYLRKDKNFAILPYVGYGYVYRFGKNNGWIFDSRLGLGATTNADKNSLLPVLKTGIGKTF
jgi:hypothetical protein